MQHISSSTSLDSHLVSSAASALSVAASQAPSTLSGPPTSSRNPTLATAIEIVASYAQLTEMQRQALYTSLDGEAMRPVPVQGGTTGENPVFISPPYR